LDFSSNAYNSFAMSLNPTADTAVIADSSALLYQDPASSHNWIFPPMLLQQNIFCPFEDLGLDTSSQDSPPVFDPLQTQTQSSNNISHILAHANKTVKQLKLMEMKEATRRLEAEIAASYVRFLSRLFNA
jgi:hypothetical protein